MELVGEARDGKEAVESYRKLRPDVTLIDLQMPRMNGMEALVAIRTEFSQAKIIVLTTYSGDIQASRALKSGASSYMLKDMLRDSLIDTIRCVNAGQTKIPAAVATGLAEHLNSNDLFPREVEVLQNVAGGCSNKLIAERLGLTEQTVKGNMKSVFSKLGADDRTHAVMIAVKRGFLDT